jgi:hypothetical protein
MEGDQLTPQQIAQLKHLSSPIRVECQRGTIRGGPSHQQIVCEGIVLKTTKSQAKNSNGIIFYVTRKTTRRTLLNHTKKPEQPTRL